MKSRGTKTLTSIQLNTPGDLSEGSTTAFACTAFYSDGSKADVTGSATFTTDFPQLKNRNQFVIPVVVNEIYTVTATYGGKTATKTLQILNDLK